MDDLKQEFVDRESEYKENYGFHDDIEYKFKTRKGLDEEIVREISAMKKEPGWMLEKRLQGYKLFLSKPTPQWGADLNKIDYNDIYYYLKATDKKGSSWEDVPDDIKKTFDKLGIPEAEQKFFAGAEAQYDSEVVYSHVKKELEEQGVIFTDTDSALKKYPEIMKKYFGTVIPASDNKFAALNTAVWSGGSFIYVPKGVKVKMPLQAYFRINSDKAGQFERTLIIADEGSEVTYIEGCFTKGTEIATVQGIKPIESVTAGDMVLTHKGRYRRVYHTQVRPHKGKLFSIKYYGDTSTTIKATEEHPFLVVKKGKAEYKNTMWGTEWTVAGELKKGDYLAIPIDRNKQTQEERVFSVTIKGRWGNKEELLRLKMDKDFFRLIGYYLSEGSMTGKSGDSYLTFTFNKEEKEYIQDTASLLEKYFGKKPIVQKEYKNGIGIVLSSTTAARFFKDEFGKGAMNKKLPEWVLHESIEKQGEMIKGIWRGDGSFMNKNYTHGAKRMFRINTISKTLAAQIRTVLMRLDILASLNVQKRAGKRHNMYCVYVGGRNLAKFASVVEEETVEEIESGNEKMLVAVKDIQTTSSFAEIVGDYAFVPIKSISYEEIENLPVYNFGVEEDESYVAGGVAVHNCTAPIFMASALHSAIVEIVAHKNAHVRYVTIQNWSKNVYNLVTQRAFAYENAYVEWIDGNIGSKINMKYPSVYLKERGARGEVLSIAVAGEGQVQDSGGKIYHLAPDTTSRIISKSVSKGSGVTSYRGLLHINKDALRAKSTVRCDALLLDEHAKTNTYPYMQISADDADISHEASVGRIGEEQLFYLMSRGLSEEESIAMIVLGFIKPLADVLPLEYSLELKRLINLDMSNSVG
ncbi:MAG: Fe-S cluster assembly protein SufB [Candidatus Micrarchaeota archaeon]|nr:Fe-S cluster assembly protein SufB [Candidatus Micrarchaeota archaeon]MDE1864946.1 Fe-S cluster assembly protein SufB [Candidatus Micrarchaeota archaeon]